MKSGDSYTCCVCGGTFTTAWTEEEAMAELEENFGVPPEECELVCDVCYQENFAERRTHDAG